VAGQPWFAWPVPNRDVIAGVSLAQVMAHYNGDLRAAQARA
jgi:hypothetical protein